MTARHLQAVLIRLAYTSDAERRTILDELQQLRADAPDDIKINAIAAELLRQIFDKFRPMNNKKAR